MKKFLSIPRPKKNNLFRFPDTLGHILLRAAQNKRKSSTGAHTGQSSGSLTPRCRMEFTRKPRCSVEFMGKELGGHSRCWGCALPLTRQNKLWTLFSPSVCMCKNGSPLGIFCLENAGTNAGFLWKAKRRNVDFWHVGGTCTLHHVRLCHSRPDKGLWLALEKSAAVTEGPACLGPWESAGGEWTPPES